MNNFGFTAFGHDRIPDEFIQLSVKVRKGKSRKITLCISSEHDKSLVGGGGGYETTSEKSEEHRDAEKAVLIPPAISLPNG